MYVLLSMVKKYLNENKRLYVAFVDMKKCFDSIYRNGLWLKLYRSGIQGNICMLQIFTDMYQKVKSCVKSCSSYSDYFEYAVGLRQGEVLSPILFSLFVEDLELYLQNNQDAGINIDEIVFIISLFADDMAIFGKTPLDLQNNLNLLNSYCDEWGLTVNTDKTKVLVFRKRGKLSPNEVWYYAGKQLETVDDFNYLGAVFNYNGSFSLNQEYLAAKALKALNVLLYNCKKLDMKPHILCKLFDSFVGSILGYASETWGYTKSKEIERIYLKFCKRLLRVKHKTCSDGVYGELGRYPLYIQRYVRMIKYWCKLITTENILLKTIYNDALKDCNKGLKNWVYNIKKLLDDFGFSNVLHDNSLVNINLFPNIFKQRVIDTFIQEWFGSLRNSSVLDRYSLVKSMFTYELYLDILPNNLRIFYTRLRLSVHPLRIQTGRYGRNFIPREERHCLCCKQSDLEDEFHFICTCPCYTELRKKYINKRYYNRPSVFKYLELLHTTNRKSLIKLASFIKEALKVRNTLL